LGPSGEIPEAARAFFSPYCLFARARSEDVMTTAVLPAFLDYLKAYLELWKLENVLPVEEEKRRRQVVAQHLSYSHYRAEKDPARGMLKRMYGEEWTERFIHDFLFDLPLSSSSSSSSPPPPPPPAAQ